MASGEDEESILTRYFLLEVLEELLLDPEVWHGRGSN
jgi:hypothetical protein